MPISGDEPTPDGSRFLALGEEMGLRLKGDSMRIERLKDWFQWAPLPRTTPPPQSCVLGLGWSWSGDAAASPRSTSARSWLLRASTRRRQADQRKCCVRSSPRRSRTTIWTLHFAIFFGASAAFLWASAHCLPPSDHFLDSQRRPRRSMSSDLASSSSRPEAAGVFRRVGSTTSRSRPGFRAFGLPRGHPSEGW